MSERSILNPETLRYVFDRLPDLVFILDPTVTYILDVNTDGAADLGWRPEEMIGQKLHRFCMPDDPTPSGVRERAAEGDVVSFDRLTLSGDGTYVNYNFVGLYLDELDRQAVLVGRPMERLLNSHSKLSDLLKLANLAADGFVVSDTNGRIRYSNQAAADMAGVSSLLGRSITDFIAIDDAFETEMERVINSGQGEVRSVVCRPDGAKVPVAIRVSFDSDSELWYSVERDISDTVARENEMRELNRALRVQASTDWLTRVANRSALEDELQQAEKWGQPFTLLILDIDDFKSVNDTMGHTAGDELLQAIAGRLANTISGNDFLARLGGDEFVLLLRDTDATHASAVAERVLESLRKPFDLLGLSVTRSCSVGIAVSDTNVQSESILRRADRALYQAKRSGRNQFVIYDGELMMQAFSEMPTDRRTID